MILETVVHPVMTHLVVSLFFVVFLQLNKTILLQGTKKQQPLFCYYCISSLELKSLDILYDSSTCSSLKKR